MSGWRLESIGRDDTPSGDDSAPRGPAGSKDVRSDYEALTADDTLSRRPTRAEKTGSSRILPLLILLCIAVLFAVSAWYVWQRLAGARSGDVPVIRADSAPVTEQPEDPGGLTIPNQDRVVLERGEVDDAVIAGETATDGGTVPITDLPLNIDSSSDVAELDEGEAADDTEGVTAGGTGENVPLVIGEEGPDTPAVPAGQVETEELAPPAAGLQATDAPEVSAEETEVAEAAPSDTESFEPPIDVTAEAEPESAAGEDAPAILIERESEAAADAAAGDVADEAASGEDAVAEVISETEQAADDALNEAADAASSAVAVVGSAAEETADAASEAASDVAAGGARVIDLAEENQEEEVAEAPPSETAPTEAPTETAPVAEAQSEPEPAETETAQAPAPPAPSSDYVPVEGGTYRVQMSSVGSEEGARQTWDGIRAAHEDLLGQFGLIVERATVNGADYHRVQVGPLDESGAIRLCEALKESGQDCFVVRP